MHDRIRDSRRIAFIGGGNMAQSLIAGLLASGRDAKDIAISDPDPAQRERLKRFTGATITPDNDRAVAGAALVVLAVKPQAAPAVLAGLGASLRSEPPLLLSVVAGLRIRTIAQALGAEWPVVRAMPNTPALIGRGASAWYANAAADEAGRNLACAVLEAVGLAVEVTDEAQMDTVTALSGSGPAYFFLLVEALAEAGAALGLPAEKAARLAAATGAGAMALLEQSDESPRQLRERVTSPGGTTAAALAAFDEGDLRGLVGRAVARAAERARELGGN